MSDHPTTRTAKERGPIFPEGWCAGAWPWFQHELLGCLRTFAPETRVEVEPIFQRITDAYEQERAAGRIKWYSPFDRIRELAALTSADMAALERARESVTGCAWWYTVACGADLRADPAGWPKRDYSVRTHPRV
jgi:hypothetical protein